jgi:hypothetical protein
MARFPVLTNLHSGKRGEGNMRLSRIAPALGMAAMVCAAPGPASAQDLSTEFNAALAGADTAAAAAVAAARLGVEPADDQARFALGIAQFLRAAEGLGQALHRYGLQSRYENDALRLAGLPFLRLPVPPNATPEPVTYEALRTALGDFVEGLARAEATLAQVSEAELYLPLELGAIRLDLNGNGPDPDDAPLVALLGAVAGNPRLYVTDLAGLTADLDRGDVAWLRGYSHLLMALGEFVLAHDWHAAYDATFHTVFPQAELPSAPLGEAADNAESLLAEFGKRPEPPDYSTFTPEALAEWQRWEDWLESPKGREYLALRDSLWYGSIADLVTFVHLLNWPVVDAEGPGRALDHLAAMVSLSRGSWRYYLAETDDRAEWIPNPDQTAALPAASVSEERVAGWMRFLDEFEPILAGDKLIPHFRFPGQGLNLRRALTEAEAFDPILLVAGFGAIPYIEDGPTTSGDAWFEIMDLMEGNLLGTFLYFN